MPVSWLRLTRVLHLAGTGTVRLVRSPGYLGPVQPIEAARERARSRPQRQVGNFAERHAHARKRETGCTEPLWPQEATSAVANAPRKSFFRYSFEKLFTRLHPLCKTLYLRKYSGERALLLLLNCHSFISIVVKSKCQYNVLNHIP